MGTTHGTFETALMDGARRIYTPSTLVRKRNVARIVTLAAAIGPLLRLPLSALERLGQVKDVWEGLALAKAGLASTPSQVALIGLCILGLSAWAYLELNPSFLEDSPDERTVDRRTRGYLERAVERLREIGPGKTYQSLQAELIGTAADTQTFSSIEDAVPLSKRTLMLGLAGAGKTTALDRLGIHFAQQALLSSGSTEAVLPVPLRIDLGRLARQVLTQRTLMTSAGDEGLTKAFLAAVTEQQITRIERAGLTPGVLRRLAQRGDVCWLLDSLDEGTPGDIDALGSVLDSNILQATPQATIVLACRPEAAEAYSSFTQRFAFDRVVTLKALADLQIEALVVAAGAPQLLDVLKQDEQLLDIARSPFALQVLASIGARLAPGELSAGEQSVYDRKHDILRRYVAEMARQGPYSEEQVHRWLGELGRVVEVSDTLPTIDYSIVQASDRPDVRTAFTLAAAFPLMWTFAFLLPSTTLPRWPIYIAATLAAAGSGALFALAPLFRRKLSASGFGEWMLAMTKSEPLAGWSNKVRQQRDAPRSPTSRWGRVRKFVENVVSIVAMVAIVGILGGSVIAALQDVFGVPRWTAVLAAMVALSPSSNEGRRGWFRVAGGIALVFLPAFLPGPVRIALATIILLGLARVSGGVGASRLARMAGGVLKLMDPLALIVYSVGAFFVAQVSSAHIAGWLGAAMFNVLILTINFSTTRIGAIVYLQIPLVLVGLGAAYLGSPSISVLVLCAITFVHGGQFWTRLGRTPIAYPFVHQLLIRPILAPTLWAAGLAPLRTDRFIRRCAQWRFVSTTSGRLRWAHALWRDYFVATALLRDTDLRGTIGHGFNGQRVLLEIVTSAASARKVQALTMLEQLWKAEGASDAFLAAYRVRAAAAAADDDAVSAAAESALMALLSSQERLPATVHRLAVAAELLQLLREERRLSTATDVIARILPVAEYWSEKPQRVDDFVHAANWLPIAAPLYIHPRIVLAYSFLLAALIDEEEGRSREAIERAQRSIQLYILGAGERDPATLNARVCLAHVQASCGEIEEATRILAEVVPLLEGHPYHATGLLAQARVHRYAGRVAEALAAAEKVRAIDRESAKERSRSELEWARCARLAGNIEDAANVVGSELAAASNRPTGKQRKIAAAIEMSLLECERGRFAEAVRISEEALAASEALGGPDAPGALFARLNLAENRLWGGDASGASADVSRAFAGFIKREMGKHPEVVRVRTLFSDAVLT
jgi:tetratricopeptide (TPR) repeat protein